MIFAKLPDDLKRLNDSLKSDFDKIANSTHQIKEKLKAHSDGKLLKGDEITGWLGEISGKMLLNGKLVSDKYEHDVEAQEMRVSVKARKGSKAWTQTSTISKIEGDDCPSHLMFIQFSDTYSILNVWLFPWAYLQNNGRFKKKRVRGEFQGYYMRISPSKDKEHLIYSVS